MNELLDNLKNKDPLQLVHENIINEVMIEASAKNQTEGHTFFDQFTDLLVDNGDLPSATYSPYIKEPTNDDIKVKSMRVDGYHYDRDDELSKNIITLIISDFQKESAYQTFNSTQLEQKFKLVERYIDTCSDPSFYNLVDESSKGFDAVYELSSRFSYFDRINIFLITNSKFSGRLKELKQKLIQNKKIYFQLFDLGRYNDLINSKSGSEPIEIEIKDYDINGLDALKTSLNTLDYQSYLVSVPGEFLSKIYEEYGARLLEQNVRTFLQARGNVNKGIISTIKNKPELFFAYNNGITATAEALSFNNNKISNIKNLQIVNGGQTTASMYYAKIKEKADLSKVYVQMKLSVINSDKIVEFVPKISEYANTQNKVNAADFFANHPFHTNIENLAESAQYPTKESSLTAEKWFYERARGAYKNKTAYSKDSERKAFEKKYPKNQVILKTDLAKYIMSFSCAPHVVSKGAQAAFLEFAKQIGTPDEYNKKKNDFHAEWFKEIICNTILFKGIDNIVAKADWYEGGGTKAPIITYSISWLVNKVKEEYKSSLDFSQVWKDQQIPPLFLDLFSHVTMHISKALQSTAPDHLKSVTQWAKRKECWEKVKLTDIPSINQEKLKHILLNKSEVKEIKKKAKKAQREYNADIDYIDLVKITLTNWAEIDEFKKLNNINITPQENQALQRRLVGQGVPNDLDQKFLYNFLKRVYELDFDFVGKGINLKF